MLTNYFVDPQVVQRFRSTPAGPYLDHFAETLAKAGFRQITIQAHVRGAVHLSYWQQQHGGSLPSLNEAVLDEFKRHLSRCRCRCLGKGPVSRRHIAGARAFCAYLRDLDVTPQPTPPRDPLTVSPLLVGFGDWMRRHRGVQESSLKCYAHILADAIHVLGDDPQRYDAATLRAFLLDRASHHSRSRAKSVATALRMFLRYLIAQGQCRPGLESAVPALAYWHLSALPRYLPATAVERILSSCDLATDAGIRDHAILLLLARLGLRGGDIVTLCLDDIDWDQATLQVIGKSHRPVRLPLPQEVGDALLDYLINARPTAKIDRVFLCVRPPVRPLAVNSTVSDIVKRAIHRAEVSAPSHGAHVLRHYLPFLTISCSARQPRFCGPMQEIISI